MSACGPHHARSCPVSSGFLASTSRPASEGPRVARPTVRASGAWRELLRVAVVRTASFPGSASRIRRTRGSVRTPLAGVVRTSPRPFRATSGAFGMGFRATVATCRGLSRCGVSFHADEVIAIHRAFGARNLAQFQGIHDTCSSAAPSGAVVVSGLAAGLQALWAVFLPGWLPTPYSAWDRRSWAVFVALAGWKAAPGLPC